MRDFMDLFGCYFQELIFIFKNKKKYTKKKGCVFIFLYFPYSQKPLFYNNKNVFSLFFHYLKNKLSFMFFLRSFYVFLSIFFIFLRR